MGSFDLICQSKHVDHDKIERETIKAVLEDDDEGIEIRDFRIA